MEMRKRFKNDKQRKAVFSRLRNSFKNTKFKLIMSKKDKEIDKPPKFFEKYNYVTKYSSIDWKIKPGQVPVERRFEGERRWYLIPKRSLNKVPEIKPRRGRPPKRIVSLI